MRQRYTFTFIVSAIILSVFVITSVEAQTIRTRQDGYWNDPSTWQGGSVPSPANRARIRHDVILNSDETVSSVIFNNSGTLTSDGSTPCTLTTNGDFRSRTNFDAGNEISLVLNGSGSNLDLQGSTFHNITINGSYQLQQNATINGTVNITPGGSLTSSSSSWTITFLQAGTPLINSGTLNLSCTAVYQSASSQSIANGTYGDLELKGSGSTKTLAGDIIVDDDLTVDPGVTFHGGTSTILLEGNGTPFQVNGSFVAENSTVDYGSSGNQNVAIVDYYNLYSSGGGEKNVSSSIFIYGDLVMGREFAVGSNTMNIQGKFESLGQGHVSGSSPTIRFFGNGNSEIIPHELSVYDVYNLIVDKNSVSDTVRAILVYNGNSYLALGIHINGSVTINSGVLDMDEVFFYATGGSTSGGMFTIQNGAIFRTEHAESLPYFTGWGVNPINFASYSIGVGSIWELDGTNQAIRGAGQSIPQYGRLVFLGSGTKTLMGSVNIATELVRTSPTNFSIGSYNLTYSNGATLTYRMSDSSGAGFKVIQTTTDNEFPSVNGPSHLVIDNLRHVNLHANRNLTGSLQFQSGKLIIGNSSLGISSTASITGASASSYVVTDGYGMLLKEDISTTPFVFPIGPDTVSYNPASLANSGVVDIYAARVQNYLSYPPVDTSKIVKRQWSFVEQTPGGGNHSLALQWNAGEMASQFDLNASVLIDRAVAGVWGDYSPAVVSGSGSWTASASGFTDLSDFHVTNDSYLPVELTAFYALYKEGSVRLTWNTASELNNAGFDVLRSIDGKEWDNIAFVYGQGTTSVPTEYNHSDALHDLDMHRDIIWYKIRQIDIDGKYSETEAVPVTIGDHSAVRSASMYPSPLTTTGHLTFTLIEDGTTIIELYDAMGRMRSTVLEQTYLEQGTHFVQVQTSNLPTGTYFCRVNSNGTSYTVPFKVAR